MTNELLAEISLLKEKIQALDKQDADGCAGCKYEDKDEYEMPCLVCKRSKIDKWTPIDWSDE